MNNNDWYLLTCSVLWEEHDILSNVENYSPFLLQGRNRIKIEPVDLSGEASALHGSAVFKGEIKIKANIDILSNGLKNRYKGTGYVLDIEQDNFHCIEETIKENSKITKECKDPDPGGDKESNKKRDALNLSCIHCKKKFYHKRRYVRHIEQICQKKLTCTVCLKVFSTKHSLKRHVHKIHSIGCFDFSCTRCKKVFKSNFVYERHIKLKTCKREYKCVVCERIFTQKGNLKRHEKLHTDRDKNADYKSNGTDKSVHKCKICKKEFQSFYKLMVHRKTNHVDEIITFKCEKCDKEFIFRCELTKHLKIHNDGPKPQKCQQCGKGFRKLSDLKRHLTTHMSEKPFKCEECGKRVRDQWCLDEHMKYHSDETPFFCHMCHRAYKTNNSLQQHMSKKHQV